MHLFYAPDASPGLIMLSEEESAHCARVLRMAAGQPILVANGRGLMYEAVVDVPHPKRTTVICLTARRINDGLSPLVHIAIAPTKNFDRIAWFVEKATEIGIGKISLFFSEHSERKLIRQDKLEKTAISAMKQSMKASLPEIAIFQSFAQLLAVADEEQRFIAWIDETVTDMLVNRVEPQTKTLVLIGPEGDFSAEEVSLAIENGFLPVSLGPSRLRTETAALVACHTIHLVNQFRKQSPESSVLPT